MRLLTTILLLFCINSITFSQKIEFIRNEIKQEIFPPNAHFKDLKTFDVRLYPSKAIIENGKVLNLEPDSIQKVVKNITYKPYAQVESEGDFHVIVLLQKMLPNSVGTWQLAFHATVYDKYGNFAFSYNYDQSNLKLPANKPKSVVTTTLINNVVGTGVEEFLQKFNTSITGLQLIVPVSFAQFEKVKKFPDLADFNAINEETLPVLREKGEKEWLKEIKKEDVDYWVQFINENEDTENDDIKRAALHNLVMYYGIKKDLPKATEYLEMYEKVDVATKNGPFGALDYKESELVRNWLGLTLPKSFTLASNAIVYKTDDILDNHRYYTINGVAIADEKSKNVLGEYPGTLKVVKTEPYYAYAQSSGVQNIKPASNINSIIVPLRDTKGTETLLINDFVQIKAKDGSEFVIRKFKRFMNIGSDYYLMKKEINDKKIACFKEVKLDYPYRKIGVLEQPKNGEKVMLGTKNERSFWICKPDDSQGVQSSEVNQKKNVLEYLSDCTEIKREFDEVKAVDFDIDKVLKFYISCK
jgi:hypothetical protein